MGHTGAAGCGGGDGGFDEHRTAFDLGLADLGGGGQAQVFGACGTRARAGFERHRGFGGGEGCGAAGELLQAFGEMHGEAALGGAGDDDRSALADLADHGTDGIGHACMVRHGIPGANHLVWEVEVGNGRDVREFVYVDAHSGKVPYT